MHNASWMFKPLKSFGNLVPRVQKRNPGNQVGPLGDSWRSWPYTKLTDLMCVTFLHTAGLDIIQWIKCCNCKFGVKSFGIGNFV